MRIALLHAALSLVVASFAQAQAPAPLINPGGAGAPAGAEAALPASANADQVLDALDDRGRSMKEFTAKVSMRQGDKFAGDESTRSGQVWFQKKGDDDGRIHVVFDKLKTGKKIIDEKVEYLFDNGWLIDRNHRKQTETRRQVLKPGEKMNLWKLGEGPFPLPIGQKKEEVRKLFDVTVIPPADKDPSDTIHLQLKPLPGTRYARRFGAIDIWVSRTDRFPAQVSTIAPDGSDEHMTKLQDVQVNPTPGLKEGDFSLPEIDLKEWTMHSESYRE